MVVRRRFERIYKMIVLIVQEKHKHSWKKELYVYGFKHIKTAEIDKYKLISCESD